MHYLTDIIVVVFAAYFFLSGWKKGVLRIILGPISLLIGTIAAYIYYINTHDLLKSLIFSIAAPVLIHLFFALILKLSSSIFKKESKPSTLSSFLAALFSLTWSGSILIFCILLIVFMPVKALWFQNIQANIFQSKTFSILDQISGKRISAVTIKTQNIANVLQDKEKMQKLQQTDEFEEIYANEHIKALVEDEETAKMLQERDVLKLMENPHMKAVLADKALLEKFLELNKKIIKETP